MPGSEITIADEVKVGCFGEAESLVKAVLADEYDLDGFHAIEKRLKDMYTLSYMPQALACLAAGLALELAEARNKATGSRETPEQVLSEQVSIQEHLVLRRQDKRSAE